MLADLILHLQKSGADLEFRKKKWMQWIAMEDAKLAAE